MFHYVAGVGGGEYRSLISTDGFVNLQEGPLRFALSVCQSDQFRRNVVCLCVCVCVCMLVGLWGRGAGRSAFSRVAWFCTG